MPLEDFDGQTWVAFSDLCGTKAMYQDAPNKAARALDEFYNAVYAIQEKSDSVSALAVSDCAILWIHETGPAPQQIRMDSNLLRSLLLKVQQLHKRMIQRGYLVRTTIAYGHFRYEQRLELPHLRKDMIIGGAYLKAYAENEKIPQGSMVILDCSADIATRRCLGELADLIRPSGDSGNLELFWWVGSEQDVERAKQKREKALQGMYTALVKAYRNRSSSRRSS